MRYAVSFSILFSFWLIWSGKFDLFHLSLGVISTLIVTVWSTDLLFKRTKIPLSQLLKEWVAFETYSFWLMMEIVFANIHIILVALSPNLSKILQPKLVKFPTKLKKEFSQFALAQSITLTPGTVTVEVTDNTFLVHALTKQTADGCPGDMEENIAKIFGEKI